MIIQPTPGGSNSGVNIGDTTDINGLIKGVDGKIAKAVDGTDYVHPKSASLNYFHYGSDTSLAFDAYPDDYANNGMYSFSGGYSFGSFSYRRIFVFNIKMNVDGFGEYLASAMIYNSLPINAHPICTSSLMFCSGDTIACMSPLISGAIAIDIEHGGCIRVLVNKTASDGSAVNVVPPLRINVANIVPDGPQFYY